MMNNLNLNKILFFLYYLLFFLPLRLQAECTNSNLNVVVLGSGGPELINQRAASGYLVRDGEKSIFLVDAGSGIAVNFVKANGDFSQLIAVLFTHLHTDHSADFPALVKKVYFTSRDRDLLIFGPSGNGLMPNINQWLNRLFSTKSGAYSYLSEYLEVEQSSDFKLIAQQVSATETKQIYQKKLGNYTIKAIGSPHGVIPNLAWRIEKDQCAITFSGDTNNPYGSLEKLAENSDLLIINNPLPLNASEAAKKLHMDPNAVAETVIKSSAKNVLLSHIMQRSEDWQIATKELILKKFKGNVMIAKDLLVCYLSKSSCEMNK